MKGIDDDASTVRPSTIVLRWWYNPISVFMSTEGSALLKLHFQWANWI